MASDHTRFPDDTESLAALADPTRRSLYEFVARSADPVSREQAAEGLGIAAHKAKFHLDRLVRTGLLSTEYRRLTGRTGPGAGRPAKLYRTAGREFSMSVPPRNYDLLSEILARAVESAFTEDAPVGQVGDVAAREARDQGRTLGETVADEGPHDCLQQLATALRPQGYEPRVDDGVMVLENCPFDKVARDHTELVCGLNLDFVGGVVSGLGCSDLRVSLEPSPGRCCVSARPQQS